MHPKTSDWLLRLIGALALSFVIDVFAAWVLESALHGLHVRATFGPCYLALCALSVATRENGK